MQCKEELNFPCTVDISISNTCHSDAVCTSVSLLVAPVQYGSHGEMPLLPFGALAFLSSFPGLGPWVGHREVTVFGF